MSSTRTAPPGAPCPACGAPEGALHVTGCDLERCPFCRGQLFSCGCVWEMLSADPDAELTDPQLEAWDALLDSKGRLPHVDLPILCARCGARNPAMFMLPTDEWLHYVPPLPLLSGGPHLQRQVLCLECFNALRASMPDGWQKAKERR